MVDRASDDWPTARRYAREISNSVGTAPPLQREHGALRVYAPRDEAATCQFKRALDDLPATGSDPLRGCVDVANVEVVEPERDRHQRRLRLPATDRLPARRKHLIGARRADNVGIRFLPVEQLTVQCKRPFAVGGEQLVPAHPPQLARLGGLQL